MPEKIKNLLNKYWDQFGEGFPLYQAPTDWAEIEYEIKKCIKENKRAAELKPNAYGARKGDDF